MSTVSHRAHAAIAALTGRGPGERPGQRDAQEVVLGQGATNALTAVQLALTYPLWVRRRKWTISYIDDTTIRQRQSVDFRWPDLGQLGPGGLVKGQEVLVPLWIARKVPLNDLDITDERGATLSLRNRYENGRVASLGMTLLLGGLARTRGIDVSDVGALSEKIEHIVTEPAASATEVLNTELQGGHDLGRILAIDDEHRGLLRDLAEGFMVLVSLRYEPGQSRVIKLSHQTPHYWHGKEGDPLAIRYGRSALASIGWVDKRQEFAKLAIGHACGTHFQIEAPEDVELSEAVLTTRQSLPSHNAPLEIKRRRVVFDQSTSSLHISMPTAVAPGQLPLQIDRSSPMAAARREDMERRNTILAGKSDEADIEIRLRPPTRGTFAAITVVTILTAGLLLLAKARLTHLDGQTSGAVLLLVPAVLAAWLARPGEHAFVSRLLGGVRLLGFGGALCALGMTALIASGSVVTQTPAGRSAPIRCTLVSGIRGRHRAASVLTQKVSCRAAAPAAGRGPAVRPSATIVARTTAWAATLFAIVLTIGLARTWIADLRRRNKDDEEKLLPSAPELSSV